MKKLLLLMFMLVAVMAVTTLSCNKEEDQNKGAEVKAEVVQVVDIDTGLKSDLNEVKDVAKIDTVKDQPEDAKAVDMVETVSTETTDVSLDKGKDTIELDTIDDGSNVASITDTSTGDIPGSDIPQ